MSTGCDIQIGVFYSFTFTVDGGTPPYFWELADGELPTGIFLNGDTGTIAGTPTEYGTFTFTIKVTDFDGFVDYITCELNLPAPVPVVEIKSVEIIRGSSLEGDWMVADLKGSDASVDEPPIFTMELADVLQLSLLPPPNAAKHLDYIYVPQPTTIGTIATVTDQTAVPMFDDFVPFIKYGVLADLLNKTGETHDPIRAQICQQLFELGVELARSLVAASDNQ